MSAFTTPSEDGAQKKVKRKAPEVRRKQTPTVGVVLREEMNSPQGSHALLPLSVDNKKNMAFDNKGRPFSNKPLLRIRFVIHINLDELPARRSCVIMSIHCSIMSIVKILNKLNIAVDVVALGLKKDMPV